MIHGSPAPIFLCGATASGKSAYAIQLAHELNGEIVNGDAFQLYRGLEVLSAAPSAEERATVPHQLYGVLSPETKYDAQAYAQLALPAIAEIQTRGKVPIVTGGSGLYLKFLTHGASPLPPGDPALRAELDTRPLEDLVAQLQSLDPLEASRTHLKNRRYVSRALEICLLTGRPVSALRDQWETAAKNRESSLRGFVIERTRSDLHARIARRTAAMLAGGAIEEVEKLSATASTTCFKAIGFQQISALLDGEIDLPRCTELINAATRQYAKRQETWFRREKWLKPISVSAT